jgi:NAD(P)-dependent dehydrogenase (short-subunit alcohol dehydrogenase family)
MLMEIIGDALSQERNTAEKPHAIVVGASSDIGAALCRDWLAKGWTVSGTYRTMSDEFSTLSKQFKVVVNVDFGVAGSVDDAGLLLKQKIPCWSVLVIGPGTQDPIGAFSECHFDDWAQSVTVNYVNQMRIVHALLPNRNNDNGKSASTVIFFAGGGVNNAPLNYSAYVSSKIALVKMTEVLAAEIDDTKFVVIGPGWVNTKFHKALIRAAVGSSGPLKQSAERLKTVSYTPLQKIVDCCNVLIAVDKNAVSGRNFSVVHDRWDTSQLYQELLQNSDMYKLRRFGNNN